MTLLTVSITTPSVTAETVTAVNASSCAKAAVLYEPTSGRVLFEKNAHTALPMASTTKLMTALLACERLSPDSMITVTAEAVAVEGSSMGLAAGDVVSRHDLLVGLLLSSGNDAANVLALSMADTYEAFAGLMNERAAQIGMTESRFVTPSGLDAEGHGASAYDMALLAAEVLRCEEASAVCRMQTATVSVGTRKLTLRNHNKLLSRYDGAVGMKTGYTSLAGRCLVSAAMRNGVTLIAVTLHCPNDWEEHTALLDDGFELCETVSLSTSLPKVTVFGGENVTVALETVPQTVTMLRGEASQIDTRLRIPPYIWAPMASGTVVGTVEYRLHGAVIARARVCTVTDVSQTPSSFWRRCGGLFTALLKTALS